MRDTADVGASLFHFVMIKPSHYDDDGYPIQWLRSAIGPGLQVELTQIPDVIGMEVREQHARICESGIPQRTRFSTASGPTSTR